MMRFLKCIDFDKVHLEHKEQFNSAIDRVVPFLQLVPIVVTQIFGELTIITINYVIIRQMLYGSLKLTTLVVEYNHIKFPLYLKVRR